MCALAGRGATARARNSARSPVVNPLQHGAGGVVHHDVAPRQYPPRDLEEPVPAHAGAARATPGEWGDVLGRPHVVEDVRARADHGPGAEQSADRRLRMVADQAAEQLQTGLETRPRELETGLQLLGSLIGDHAKTRSEEHTSELQSQSNLA